MDCRLADSIKSMLCFMKLVTVLWLWKKMPLLFESKSSDMFRGKGHDVHDLLSGIDQEEKKYYL